MMGFKPKCLGSKTLDTQVLSQDRKLCVKIGPCGIGQKAVYLNSFYIDRMYYVPFENISRIFKRVAMSKGGFTGKGVFGSMAYLVVQLKDGSEKQCNFKFEQDVDRFLDEVTRQHPQIPIHSAAAEQKLREAEAEEQAKYLKELSAEAKRSVKELEEARELIDRKPILAKQLTFSAKQKRTIDHINPTYRYVAAVILAAGIIAAAFGVWSVLMHRGGFGVYFLLFGFAGILVVAASRVLPTGKSNRRAAQNDWDQALREMTQYLKDTEFPVPPQYAHPIVLDRMIRAIRQGRAVTQEEAFEVVKEDLKALNSSVTVSQKEYDEVVAVKPMFLVCNYQ